MSSSYYRSSSSTISYYPSTTGSTEPNMREELINTLDGRWPEVAKGQTGLLRRMRTDSAGNKIPCGCVDTVTHEPDRDRWCPICFGEGWLFDETYITFYKRLIDSETDNSLRDRLTEVGLINVPLVVFYVRYSTEINEDDKIVEIALEDDGSVSTPTRRTAVYKIATVWDYRADNGKLEYYKIFTHEEKVKYLNAPGYEDLA